MVARSRSTCHYSTSIEGMIQNRKLQSTSCGLLEKDARTGTEEEVGGGERIDPHERKHETRRRDLASRGIKTWTLAAVPTTKEERERKTGQRLSNSRSSSSFRFGAGIGEYLLAAIIAVGIQYEIKIHYVRCV